MGATIRPGSIGSRVDDHESIYTYNRIMFDDDWVDLSLDDSWALDQRQFGHRDDRIREAVEIAFRHAAVAAYHREAGYFIDHLMGFGKANGG